MKKKLKFVIVSYLFLQLFSLHAQNVKNNKKVASENLTKKIVNQLSDYKKLNFHEKIYMHFDKPFYAVGEDIWFSVYLVDAEDHSGSVPSNIVYVELINPKSEIVSTKTIKVKDGKAAGDFEIQESLNPGVYAVRAYTNYMRNYDPDFFFTKRVDIKSYNSETFAFNNKGKFSKLKPSEKEESNLSDIDFQIFPEGGDLIEGLPAFVGFKTINNLGRGVDIEGGIFNQSGEMVTFFRSSKFGIGSFNFLPKNGNSYTAKFKIADNEYSFSLPQAKPEGYVMRVDNSHPKQIKILLKSNMSQGIGQATLIAHTRGRIAFTQDQFPNQKEVQVKVDKSDLKNGILHLTLFDGEGLPQSERLVFIYNKDKELTTNVNIEKDEFSNRKPVKVAVSLVDNNGKPLKGNLSVSVTNSELVSHDRNAENIKSYLLLNSDLKGVVENPNYYLTDINNEKVRALDHLMLTHGWRRFSWNDVAKKDQKGIKFYPEKGVNISGRLADYFNTKKAVKGKVELVSMKEMLDVKEVETSEDGQFLFMGYDLPPATDIIVKATGFKKKKRKKTTTESVKILLDEFENASVSKDLFSKLVNSYTDDNNNSINENYARELEKIKTYNQLYNFNKDAIVLEELTIKSTSQKKKDPYYFEGRIYTTPSHRVDFNKTPITATARGAFEALESAMIPGLSIRGTFPNYCVSIRATSRTCGKIQPVFLLDNMVVDATAIATLSPNTIHYVDIVQNSALYGVRGAGGIIAVYTKQGIDAVPDPKGVISFKSPSYNMAREFYSPKYEIAKSEHAKPDQRITLYWNPKVKINEKGEAEIEFYTSDDNAKFRIDIQGISENGQPLLAEKSFIVKKSN